MDGHNNDKLCFLPLSGNKAKGVLGKIKNCWLKGKKNTIKY